MNERGQYGRQTIVMGSPRACTHVGLVTATSVEHELNQLNGEIEAFDKQLREQLRKSEADSPDAELRRVNAELDALEPTMARLRDLGGSIARIRELMEKNPQAHALEFQQALLALDKFMPIEKRREVSDRYTKLALKRDELRTKSLGDSPLFKFKSAWQSFKENWIAFSHPGKVGGWGAWGELDKFWDLIQDYRQQFVDLYQKAPFKALGPKPLDPSGREAPGILGGLGLEGIGSVLKWTLIGTLGIVGAVAVSSVIANVRKGRDPIEHYTELYRGRKAST